ncbi:ABC transporter substrate-binding protein [Flavimaricola marinus]|uniref:Maltose-binding periplasmic protein n=1 Tax=Flavimaricola marinus TaxID=1819565 RepID=A0A238LAB0_9RHOB|nr:sugar ABC transporter substrate-binding protein [Flavimaricola marinus]SMY06667.1 Maltose-binding periplasmic protein precursor [Flavimaricola marinus]
MTPIKTLAIGATLLGSTAMPAFAESHATEMHVIMCGDEVFPADQVVIDEFVATHDGVTVNLESVPWSNCQDKSLTLAAAGDPPSLAYMGSRTLRQLATNDLIVPVTFTQEQMDAFQPGVLKTVTYDGQQWGLPHAFSTKALYLNCDLIEAAGATCEAPATWDDMMALAQQVVDNTDAAGIGVAGKDFDNTMHQFLNYLYSNGGQVIADDGSVALDSPETRETLEFYASLVSVAQEGVLEWERDAMVDLFNDGQIAMYINGPWGWGRHNEEINQMVVPVPAGPSGVSGTLLITDSIVVFNGSGHEDLALELASAMTSGQAQYELDNSWGLTPILQYEKLGFSDLFYEADPAHWANFISSIPTGGPEPLITDYRSLQAVFVNMIQGAILEEDSIDNLVSIAAEELADAL